MYYNHSVILESLMSAAIDWVFSILKYLILILGYLLLINEIMEYKVLTV